MDYLADLRKKYEEKREQGAFTEEENEFLTTFLKDEFGFLRVTADEAKGIMCSLGVAEDKVLEYYTNIFIASLKKAKGSQNTKK